MIKLRELSENDAPLMLEWMHDPDIQKGFKKPMMKATMEDALAFIRKSKIPNQLATGDSVHFAVVNCDDNQYLGTVSLKNLDFENGNAEYAIIIRKNVQGLGIAHSATELILKKAFLEIGLNRVYLSVYSNNDSAIKLYERCGFVYEGEFREHFCIGGERVGWKWYGLLKEEYLNNCVERQTY